jgi:hypothetical protein
VVVLLGACVTRPELEPGEAYVLSRFGFSSEALVDGLVFSDADSEENFLMKPGRAVLTRVKPGRYYFRLIRTGYFNVMGHPNDQPEALIPIVSHKINYVGSWGVIVDDETSSKITYKILLDFPNEVVEYARSRNEAVFSLYPVVEARATTE